MTKVRNYGKNKREDKAKRLVWHTSAHAANMEELRAAEPCHASNQNNSGFFANKQCSKHNSCINYARQSPGQKLLGNATNSLTHKVTSGSLQLFKGATNLQLFNLSINSNATCFFRIRLSISKNPRGRPSGIARIVHHYFTPPNRLSRL